MKLIIKNRGQGKTTQLIYTSEITRYPIVTTSRTSVELIKNLAKELACNIPEPITYTDLKNNKYRGNKNFEKVLVDDVDSILEEVLNEYLNCEVIGVTISKPPCK